MTTYQIKDNGDPRKYYIQVPNIIDDLGLSVYAFRLYVHLKRVAGDSGTCYQSTKTLSDSCKMAMGSVKNAKEELVKAKLIELSVIHGDHGEFDRHEITITDIWADNMKKYAHSPGEQDAFTTRTGPDYQVNRTVPPDEQDRSPGELKNNPLKNNKIKNNDSESSSLSTGQSKFLQMLGAKRYANKVQALVVLELEKNHGTEKLIDATKWAATNGMGLGKAIQALQKALPNWGKPRPGKNGNTPETPAEEW